MSTYTSPRDGFQNNNGEQVVLVLVGLIGSGKVPLVLSVHFVKY
jgi:hypothetical protein